ncbi:MAG: hypothetical protein MJB14_15045 [Spirochaetes bacterium]|nr:hypothetical protein [Spirochaetota bacterium]
MNQEILSDVDYVKLFSFSRDIIKNASLYESKIDFSLEVNISLLKILKCRSVELKEYTGSDCISYYVKYTDKIETEVKQEKKTSYNFIHKKKKSPSLITIPLGKIENSHFVYIFNSNKEHPFSDNNLKIIDALIPIIHDAINSRRVQAALKERIKELSCLYKICQTFLPELTLDEILMKIVKILPPAMQYPKYAFVRIFYKENIYKTKKFLSSMNFIKEDLYINRKIQGSIEIHYVKNDILEGEKIFLIEEINLLKTVAKQISLVIEKKITDTEKKDIEKKLIHTDRLASIGILSSGIAHEINNPLSNILGFAQLSKKIQILLKKSIRI